MCSTIKKLAKEVCVSENPTPDVQRVGGGVKTNISLLERFENGGGTGVTWSMKNISENKYMLNEEKTSCLSRKTWSEHWSRHVNL